VSFTLRVTNNPVKINVKSGKVEKLVKEVDTENRGSRFLQPTSGRDVNKHYSSSVQGSSKLDESMNLNLIDNLGKDALYKYELSKTKLITYSIRPYRFYEITKYNLTDTVNSFRSDMLQYYAGNKKVDKELDAQDWQRMHDLMNSSIIIAQRQEQGRAKSLNSISKQDVTVNISDSDDE